MSHFLVQTKCTVKSRSRASSDDDDFIVPDDDGSEVETRSAKTSSSRRSSMSSRRSAASSDGEDAELDEDDLEDDAPKISRPKTKSKAPAKSSTKAVPAGNGSFSFMTAAEQREKGVKDDKKAAESPYDFLLDVRDVRYTYYSARLFSDINGCI